MRESYLRPALHQELPQAASICCVRCIVLHEQVNRGRNGRCLHSHTVKLSWRPRALI